MDSSHSSHSLPVETEFPTPFGGVRLIWGESAAGPKVVSILLPGDKRVERFGISLAISMRAVEDEKIHGLITDIQSFLSGDDGVIGMEILDLDRCRPFLRRVLLAEHAIPRGYVSTYGRIARYIGVPGGARAVGNALACNPFPLVIPCHRALLSDGSPGGFRGGQEMKIRLLEMEGVRFHQNGKVQMDHVWY